MLEILRIASVAACVLAAVVFAGLAALLAAALVAVPHPLAPLVAGIFAVPAVMYIVLARYAMRKE